jgi:SAM-dependent methyltransferase
MTCAGYLEYDPGEEQYSLPPEYAMVLANDGGPMCFAGAVQQVGAFAQQLPALLDAFRNGEGLPQASYSSDLYEGMERLSATWFEHELVETWIPTLPEVVDKLRAGGRVADVGCGSGRALIQMAKAFPVANFVGYDTFPVVLERATRGAAAAGVTNRVNFEIRDLTKGLPAEFDLVTAFDSLHDLPDPVDGLRAMARGLKNDGTLLVLELALCDDLLEEQGPLGVILHATKLFYNLPVGIAAHGATGGNGGFSESVMRSLCRQAALRYDRCMPVRNPLHKLHVIKTQTY